MRARRLTSLAEAVGSVRSGMTVGLSGFSYMNPPLAAVREMIRRGLRDLTLVSGPSSGLETDLLIAAGCVREVVTACVAFEQVAGIAPSFRRAAEAGEIRVWECDECLWHLSLKAQAYRMPYLLWPGGVGTSLPDLNPDLVPMKVDGRFYLRVPPRRIEVSFIHVAAADAYGNAQFSRDAYLGRNFCETELAQATVGPVFVTTERLIPNREVRAHPERTLLRNVEVIEAPWGAHPGGASGVYVPDLPHVRQYVKAAELGRRGDRRPLDHYLDRWVRDLPSHQAYIEAVGPRALRELALN